ncbi:MAG: Multidrug efflux pump P55 [uncultured Nocardioidaceae bacterium]|uniref:Multidrug efflux pump P55 n=1 Tax=uncultured Nocardioidaceae bacterium TaxID=253824 RepID=A0A6J4LTA3_9ACTN|nr:MAG: Multidrug efflux pump P55 [uncultured Nocardioidaceae bacterium]
MSPSGPDPRPGSGPGPGRLLLGLAAVAVAFAAADTYVVVLALPDMMASAGLSAQELQRAAPIVSGFLLGYVAVLPLVGRIADLRGRLPVLVGSLVAFAIGSLVTAAAYDLPSVVTGRFLQGLGGGGLVPATLALVGDLYPPHRRGVPLGVVGAVQEIGSVLGPLYGAVVLAFADWRAIFWLNLVVGVALAMALRRAAPGVTATAVTDRRGPPDLLGAGLLLAALAGVVLVMQPPGRLTSDVTLGLGFLPVVGSSRWLTPVGLAVAAIVALLVLRCLTARRPLVDLRSWPAVARSVDLLGAALLSTSLGAIVLAFATADPEVQVLSPAGPPLLGLAAVAAGAFVLRNRVARQPLVPTGALRPAAAWGSLAVSFFVGAGLIAALVDVPLFARVTVHPESQLLAALVLVRFLVALPVGALAGGWLTQRLPAGLLTAGGMSLAVVGFLSMSRWGLESLSSPVATVPLVVCGLGFGLALAPVNAALLASTNASVHGVASALLVVARMVGMLVGISALTTLGLRRFYAAQGDLPPPMEVCDGGRSRCEEFELLLREAGLTQLQTVFVGAAVCCAVAAVLALLLFRGVRTREERAPVLAGRPG